MNKKWIGALVVVVILVVALGFFMGRSTAPINAPTSTATLTAPADQNQQTTAAPKTTPTETSTQIAPASQPASPTAEQPAVVQPTPPAPICTVIHDYQLKDLPEVATSSGNFLHVEYWTGGSAPEYETILPGGRYLLRTNFAGGHVWEYGPGCDFDQVMEQVNAHIARRIAQKAKNGGYVNWESTGYFIPVR
jgi:hypothetical protein